MTRFQGALLHKCGIEFALMVVEEHVIDNPLERTKASAWGSMFFHVPTVLVSERQRRTFGRDDILPMLRDIDIARIPWCIYAVAA